jgi:thymidylate synthase ThyX
VTVRGDAFDTGRAERLYERVFFEYGDDSVAQLGGVHLACEGASNILTKVLEWGRLMAYLEQSTRYIPYDDRPAGRYRYHVPAELTGGLRERYVAALDRAFDVYREWLPRMRAFYEVRHPRDPGESESVYRMTIRAQALDTLRLPQGATASNVGIYATGQAYEQLLLRMRAHPLAEVRSLRRSDAGRAAQGDAGLPAPGGHARAWRGVVGVPERDAGGDAPGRRAAAGTRGRRSARHRLDERARRR